MTIRRSKTSVIRIYLTLFHQRAHVCTHVACTYICFKNWERISENRVTRTAIRSRLVHVWSTARSANMHNKHCTTPRSQALTAAAKMLLQKRKQGVVGIASITTHVYVYYAMELACLWRHRKEPFVTMTTQVIQIYSPVKSALFCIYRKFMRWVTNANSETSVWTKTSVARQDVTFGSCTCGTINIHTKRPVWIGGNRYMYHVFPHILCQLRKPVRCSNTSGVT